MWRILKKIKRILFPKLKVSKWADRYRYLAQETSAEPGQWNTDRAPYQRKIMDAVSDSKTDEIIIMSASQMGKTELILNIIGYFIDYDPSLILCILPLCGLASEFSRRRLDSMIRSTPRLKKKVVPKPEHAGISLKDFPGGKLTVVGQNLARYAMKSHIYKVVLIDEIDRFSICEAADNDVIKIAKERTKVFPNRKIIKASTPTIKGQSLIEKEYLASSMEKWCVPCPCCGKYQPYEWGRIRFSDVTMVCKFCGKYSTEMEWKNKKGKWIAFAPKNRRKRGFHISALASPWIEWNDIISCFREANRKLKNGDDTYMRAWVNTMLGETWEAEDAECHRHTD